MRHIIFFICLIIMMVTGVISEVFAMCSLAFWMVFDKWRIHGDE
jgi:hypothetical protein